MNETEPSEYESAFGLTDNPFCPNAFGAVGERALDDISSAPLELDREPDLARLFVPDAGPFRGSIELFEKFLRTKGYTPAGPERRKKSMAFRLLGPEGSGKTTLANYLVKRVAECVGKDLLVVKASARKGAEEAVESVRAQAGEHGAPCCCIVVDDARLEHEEALHSLYEELRDTAPVVSFEVVHDAHDLDRQRRVSASGLAEDLRTGWLTPDHAEAFVRSRIELFRAPGAADELSGELELFPFERSEIRAAVAADAGADDVYEDGRKTLTLRIFNIVLNRGLELDLARRREEPPIAGLGAEALRARTIAVLRSYEETMPGYTGAPA